eukprot:CAMPEP_0119261410 /NCGR_PEP_ID=MMETSP1329-20130426/1487_1 /TAXON_ID=114041 /ORGANISM="Genus nov. species nov., Strain RCC1024" /LENGTH=354 /DNA_ID=CAMNT_0007260967 /DNA_START=109 /DNA_END=1170 /DNA_ORIENTATION=+
MTSYVDDQDAAYPAKLGPYELRERLGSGGFSRVFLARDSRDGSEAALKIGAKDEERRQLAAEAAMLETVAGHDHVVALLCAFEEGLALELGVELYDFLEVTGAFEDAVAATYAGQLLGAIAHCHSLAVAHRDVKPENLLLDGAQRLKLADFGLAVRFEGSLDHAVGTAAYLAPEVLGPCERHERLSYDAAAADVWSAAVVCFVLAKGAPPLAAASHRDAFYGLLAVGDRERFWAGHAPFSPSAPARHFLDALLVSEPGARPTAAQAAAHPWPTSCGLAPPALAAAMAKRSRAVAARVSFDEPPALDEWDLFGAWDGADPLLSAHHMPVTEEEVYRSLDDALPPLPPPPALVRRR